MSEGGNHVVAARCPALDHTTLDSFLLKLTMLLPCSEMDQITDLVKKDPERKANTKTPSKSKCDMGLEVRSQFYQQDYQVIAEYLGATTLLNRVWVPDTHLPSGLVANHGLFQKHLV